MTVFALKVRLIPVYDVRLPKLQVGPNVSRRKDFVGAMEMGESTSEGEEGRRVVRAEIERFFRSVEAVADDFVGGFHFGRCCVVQVVSTKTCAG